MTTRSALATAARAAAILALAAAAVIATGCSSDPKCWRIAYEKTGTTPEASRADLADANQEAHRRYPTAPVSTDPNFVNQINARRAEVVRVSMEARGYTQIRIPVDCETGAKLAADR